MKREKLIYALARKLYEARHPSPEFPTWDELQTVKTYKITKYRQLAEVAVDFLSPPEEAVGPDAA